MIYGGIFLGKSAVGVAKRLLGRLEAHSPMAQHGRQFKPEPTTSSGFRFWAPANAVDSSMISSEQ
jgi:hypothetical protein